MRQEIPATLHPEMRLTFRQVQALTGDGKTKAYSDMKAGKHPLPEKDGPRFARWRAGDILEYLARRRAASRGE